MAKPRPEKVDELYNKLRNLGMSVMADERSDDKEVARNRAAFKAARGDATPEEEALAWKRARTS